MDRRSATGTCPCTATTKAPSTSPPAGPAEVAPTRTPRVLDQLDEPVVAGLMDPATGRRRQLRDPGPHGQALVAGLPLGQPHRPDLGVGERHPGHGAVAVGRSVLAEDVPGSYAGLVHRHVGEGALAGDVTDRPQPVGGPHPLIGATAAAFSSMP